MTYLDIPFLIYTWRPKVNKGFLLTGGLSVSVLLKKSSVTLPDGEYQFSRWGAGWYFGLGYDFSFGLGIRLVGNTNFFILPYPDTDEKIFGRFGNMGNCVLTYRF